jgi:hypothetical protein
MNLVRKLLKQHVNKTQLAGFFVANWIGLSVILIAVRFYVDISDAFNAKDTLFKRDFFTVSKKVGVLNSFQPVGFSEEEIEEIKEQNFTKEVGEFTPSRFSVTGGVTQHSTGMGFNSELFFESVPEQFIDVDSKEWKYDPGGEVIPIIVPRNYLNLYNFGFAEAHSMPKISEGVISLISIDINISGNGKETVFKGHIVGFSDRINTILVPGSFMDWANDVFGRPGISMPSRLIVEVENVADPGMAVFLKEKGYVVEGENQAVGRMSFLLRGIVGIVAGVGLIICILSIVILMLSIFLLLQKDKQKLEDLRLMGYSKRQVSSFYERLIVGINSAVAIGAVLPAIGVSRLYNNYILTVWPGFKSGSLLYVIGTAFAFLFLFSFINIAVIRRMIK